MSHLSHTNADLVARVRRIAGQVGAVERALRQFERLARRHSRSLYARLAAYRISECKERLARHELRIGEFYLDSDQPEAAQARLHYIVEQYADTDTARHAASLINQTRD